MDFAGFCWNVCPIHDQCILHWSYFHLNYSQKLNFFLQSAAAYASMSVILNIYEISQVGESRIIFGKSRTIFAESKFIKL